MKPYFFDQAPAATAPPRPRMARLNDLPTFERELFAAAQQHQVPYELVVAQAFQESQWTLTAYRYEPGYDRRYISRTTTKPGEHVAPAQVWSKDPSWRTTGITAASWFTQPANRARLAERVPKVKYDFIAQLEIAASHGPLQVMLPTARRLGFQGPAIGMHQPAGVRIGVYYLDEFNDRMRARGLSEKDALKVALATYNGGTTGNTDPRNLRNIDYVRLVERRYQQCWGVPFFGAL